MYFANDENGHRIHIDEAKKGEKYICPVCGESLIMKCGDIVTHHFSHKSRENCDPWYTEKMSEWHRNLQKKFPIYSQEQIVWSKDHKDRHIADILFRYRGETYVIEFQHSPMSRREFDLRSRFYLDLGFILIWVFDFCECEAPKRIYYNEVDTENGIVNIIWPGRDRVRFLDGFNMLEYADLNHFHIFFHVSVGFGQLVDHFDSYGASWSKWEYFDPKKQDRCFLEPRYSEWECLGEFEAFYYMEDEFYSMLSRYTTEMDNTP